MKKHTMYQLSDGTHVVLKKRSLIPRPGRKVKVRPTSGGHAFWVRRDSLTPADVHQS